MIRPILTYPDERLATPCEAVGTVSANVQILAADLLETMYSAEGRGLAAPQVGEMHRIFVMDAGWKDGKRSPMVLVNPEVVAQSDEVTEAEERCLSIPDVTASVSRPVEITLAYTNLSGERQEETLNGDAARIAQHEIDHLDGKLTFDRVSTEERSRLETAYDG